MSATQNQEVFRHVIEEGFNKASVWIEANVEGAERRYPLSSYCLPRSSPDDRRYDRRCRHRMGPHDWSRHQSRSFHGTANGQTDGHNGHRHLPLRRRQDCRALGRSRPLCGDGAAWFAPAIECAGALESRQTRGSRYPPPATKRQWPCQDYRTAVQS